jgi:glutaredoxin
VRLRRSVKVLLWWNRAAPRRLLSVLVLLAASLVLAQPLELFTREGCPHCLAAEHFVAELQRERPEFSVQISRVDRDAQARQRLELLARERGLAVVGVPALLVRDELLVGFDRPETTGARIRALLIAAPGAPNAGTSAEGDGPVCSADAAASCASDEVAVPIFGTMRASVVGLPVFTVVVGLLDGFNPCAMWVLLFLLSLLVNLKSRARMALVAGTFVAVSAGVYFAFMAAWLNVFLLLGFSRAVQIALGLVALLVGALNVKEFVAFKRGPSLTIPDSAKPSLYARMRAVLQADHVWGALVSVAVLAVMVNVVELLCTAGLPAVYTHVLTAQHLSTWRNYGYLLLYNAAYMLDDSVMVALAVVTLSRRKLEEGAGRWLKLVSGVVMVGLSLVLVFKPGWLALLG